MKKALSIVGIIIIVGIFLCEARIGATIAQCDSMYSETAAGVSRHSSSSVARDTLPGTSMCQYIHARAFSVYCVFVDGVCQEISYVWEGPNSTCPRDTAMFRFFVGEINLPELSLTYDTRVRILALDSLGREVGAFQRFGPYLGYRVSSPVYLDKLSDHAKQWEIDSLKSRIGTYLEYFKTHGRKSSK